MNSPSMRPSRQGAQIISERIVAHTTPPSSRSLVYSFFISCGSAVQ
jgi:hypothetical protein